MTSCYIGKHSYKQNLTPPTCQVPADTLTEDDRQVSIINLLKELKSYCKSIRLRQDGKIQLALWWNLNHGQTANEV